MQAEQATRVLMPVEAEAYVEALETLTIKDIGTDRWLKQHEYIEKLNMQAIISASSNEDEFVKEFLVSYDKIPVLIHELLTVEVWTQKIFSLLVRMDFQPSSTIPVYTVLYHEATIINLLETIMYHKDTCESAEDTMLDLLDYCYRKIVDLIARSPEEDEGVETPPNIREFVEHPTTFEDLKKQQRALDFDVAVKAVTILRYITDHLDSLPLSTTHRLLNTHNIPILLVQLVENCPWTRESDGRLRKYVDGKWQEVPPEDRMRLTKIEGQVWIALYNVLMGPDCQQKYEYNDYNKNQVLKVRGYLHEVLLDQFPHLAELQRYLEHLSMMEPPAARKDLVLEQVPEVRERILQENKGKWEALAKHQVKTVFNPSTEQLKELSKRWAVTYNLDLLESMLVDPPKCAVCGEPASKRCSRCQNEWYCRRECQVGHWPKHKKACDLMTNPQSALS
ncbi:PREDICTED: zinc finger MYND domain-containing protein 10-like [Branchiostoma belcheri]|uniref:Zinc finger MYND domain-containing protein 10 n=1 Tax=Branchiostoma belcheri TaxID=7741 RepID=A0A6P4YXU4_BRABE|nr:PREDICTED: zinc finger MYND domain-containing protein 10-like [Branchiostoma belcheri]